MAGQLVRLFRFFAGLLANNPVGLSGDVDAFLASKSDLRDRLAKAKQDRAAVIVLMTQEISALEQSVKRLE